MAANRNGVRTARLPVSGHGAGLPLRDPELADRDRLARPLALQLTPAPDRPARRARVVATQPFLAQHDASALRRPDHNLVPAPQPQALPGRLALPLDRRHHCGATINLRLASHPDCRPIAITRKDVETRFNGITADHGWSAANRAMSLLRSVYRRPCVDLDGLRNPVDLWLAGGGKFHRKKRRKISAPAEVLPCWPAGIEAEVHSPAIRDALWFGLYTGMRREEVLTLRWERIDLNALTFRVEETKTGVPLELPVTRQLAATLERRLAVADDYPPGVRDWVFPSPTSATGHVQDIHHLYSRIGKAGGAKFWFHGLRNCFITVAERELMLPSSLTKRLVNHAPPNDVTEGYAADWTVSQLRAPAQNIADQIEAMLAGSGSIADAA